MPKTILSRCEQNGLRLTEQRRVIAQVLEASVTMRIGGVVILEVVALVVAVVITGMYVKLLKPYISKACIEVERAADLLAQARSGRAVRR